MKLESIRVRNYRCHRDLEVQFAPHFNAIVGVNGSGKTSLLNAVCDAMSAFLLHLASLPGGHYMALRDTAVVRLQVDELAGRLRFEPQYPVIIDANATAYGETCMWSISKAGTEGNAVYSGKSPGDAWQMAVKKSGVSAQSTISTPLPLIAFYRATRQWRYSAPNEIAAATQRDSKLSGYAHWTDAALDFTDLQRWAISKSLERLESAAEDAVAFDQVKDDELALVNSAIATAVDGAKGLRYDFRQKSLLVEWQPDGAGRREPTQFETLSDGQRAIVGLVSDIARRICLLNPQLGANVISGTFGVVLIDELDLHLHPSWQRVLTTGLKKAFPSVQFIVASHSPQVLGELQPNEIIMLKSDGVAHPEVSYGLDSSLVLEEIMGSARRTPGVADRLSELFTVLERNNLEGAKQILAALRIEIPGVPELDGADALLYRKEIIGK